MSEVKTYPAMNETIKGLLALDPDDKLHAYVLARIMELEAEVAQLKEEAEKFLNELN